MKTFWIAATLVSALLVAGCVGGDHGYTPGNPAPVDDMAGIDSALEKGPVLVEFEANWSADCAREQAVIDGLKAGYPGVTFMDVNIEENGRLSYLFSVNDLPQTDVIVKKNADGTYEYAGLGNGTTYDRRASAIIGYHDEQDLKETLDSAVKARG